MAKPPDPKVDPARAAALRLLGEVTEHGRTLAEAMPKVLASLAPADRARAQRIATGTLRWTDRADRMLGPFLRMKPRPGIHNLLRMALYEIHVDGGAAHGVVSAAVDLAATLPQGASQAGLVNGVLRNVARQGPGAWDALPLPRLPKWLRKPLVADYGKAVVADMEAAFAAPPPLDLSVKDDAEGWARRLGGQVLPTGGVRLGTPGQVSRLDGFEAGAWWVQDAAAAVPAHVLAPRPGERVLDLCAAPGGKTMQLALSGAEVTALDLSAARMARVEENLARVGLSARIEVGNALAFRTGAPFDAVLLDAPCTATGTLRRHPDLPHARTPDGFPEIFALQARLIDAALDLVRPGGRVVFCTCSLLFDEGEEQVRDAMERHPGLVADPAPLALPGIDPAWIGPEGGLRLRPDYWPELGGMDGFYVASLRRPPC